MVRECLRAGHLEKTRRYNRMVSGSDQPEDPSSFRKEIQVVLGKNRSHPLMPMKL